MNNLSSFSPLLLIVLSSFLSIEKPASINSSDNSCDASQCSCNDIKFDVVNLGPTYGETSSDKCCQVELYVAFTGDCNFLDYVLSPLPTNTIIGPNGQPTQINWPCTFYWLQDGVNTFRFNVCNGDNNTVLYIVNRVTGEVCPNVIDLSLYTNC